MVGRDKYQKTVRQQKVIPKAIWTFQGSRQDLSRRIPDQPPWNMGNPRRVSRVPPYALQGDRRTRNQLPRTTSRTDRRGGRMGSRTDPRKTPLRLRKEATISRKMEGLFARPQSMGR